MINSVSAGDFPAVYPKVKRFFDSFYERANGCLLEGSLEQGVIAQEYVCYIALRGADIVACALCEITEAGSIIWDCCAGDDDDEWPEEMLEMFEQWAADMGARLIVPCRPGWVRRLKMTERGYRETHRVMELDTCQRK